MLICVCICAPSLGAGHLFIITLSACPVNAIALVSHPEAAQSGLGVLHTEWVLQSVIFSVDVGNGVGN